MAKRKHKRLVIDADIVSAASESTKEEPKHCRNFLVAVRKHKYRIALSTELRREWRRHHSKYSLRWWTSMKARRLVVRLHDYQDQNLRKNILRYAPDAKLEEMRKDIHLLEAALKTDQIVASKDDKARDSFASICQHIGEIRRLMWVNPVLEGDSCTGWLERGAPVEPERQLGYGVSS